MSVIISMSQSLQAAAFAMGIRRNDFEERSDPTGIRANRIGLPQWKLHMVSAKRMTAVQFAIWQQMILKLDGETNYLAAFDIFNTAPRGTMRGTLTLSGAVSAGATTCNVTGGAGQAAKTLLVGDWLTIGAGLTCQLVKVTDDATADGAGLITGLNFRHPLRYAQSGGAAVTWDHAFGHFKCITEDLDWAYDPGTLAQGSIALDFLEQW